ncbi:MAG TPA: amino acid adenylation domain-containing protein, partial [Bryobacteraceae bacterium]|nr:amino acid adenylation domain-containing protein [Bryobacteraceae bacterium]
GGYTARITYCTDLFDAATIERLFSHWLTLLEGAIRNPDARLIDLPMMAKEETEEICIRRNATRREVPACTISQLFEQQVIRTPNAVALECGNSSLTYSELNREANRLAYRLREEGVGAGAVVAVCVERSCDMVVSVLAVLKAGAAYLPLAPEIPPERKRLILEDSEAPFLVTEPEFLNQFHEFAPAGLRIVCCGEGKPRRANPGPIASSGDLAYILYTSGSAGKPKGVAVAHSAVVNFLESMRRRPGFSARDTLLAVTTLSFDIAALEIYLPLICGGRVVLANPGEVFDLALLQELMEHLNPSVMQATPATWRALIDAGWKGSRELKILCGGESLTRELADQLLTRSAELWNMYGPTETTIWSTIHRVTPGEGPVSIGRPIDNTQVYVLDSAQHPVPDGVIGELYIGGHGLARGYFHREQLTAERFVMVEAAGNTRLYRTGDIARWRRDGTLECLGRADNQVKIRGFRVELEEIEAVLTQHPEVRAAAVAAWPDASGNLALAGYVVTAGDPDLRDFLRDHLPEYMIPSVFVRMQELPLTSNRKVDRRKLPPPALRRELAPADLSETDEERRLAGIWESVLGLANIGVDDDFFRSGGHSLLVPKLLSRVEQTFGLRLPMASLFAAPSIRKFARLLKNPAVPAAPVRTVSIRKDASERPLIWLYPGAEMRQIIKHLQCPVVGVALSPQDEAALPPDFTYEQIAALLAREVRAAQPEGPYHIGGWCSSGILAYEVASQLRLQGVDVATLILIDSLNPAKYLEMPARRRRISKMKYHLKRIAALERGRVGDYVRERVAWAHRRFRPRFSSPPASFEDRYSHATLKYVPPLYSGRVLVLSPERMPSYRDPLLHWGESVTGELQCRIVRGDHLSMFEEGAADLAEEIMAAVAPSQAAPDSGVSGNVAEFQRRMAAVNT